jgi:hypothetical protein
VSSAESTMRYAVVVPRYSTRDLKIVDGLQPELLRLAEMFDCNGFQSRKGNWSSKEMFMFLTFSALPFSKRHRVVITISRE